MSQILPPPLLPEEEQQAVDAITALDWTDSYTAPQRAVTAALGVTDGQAELIVGQMVDRRIIRMIANTRNLAETGPVPREGCAKWERAEVPTTLEVIRQLTALEGYVSLDRTREVVSRFCGCSIDEANGLLHDLQDKNLLTLTGEGWRRCGAMDAA